MGQDERSPVSREEQIAAISNPALRDALSSLEAPHAVSSNRYTAAVQEGNLVAISPDELLPEARKRYDEAVKGRDGKTSESPLPVMVDEGGQFTKISAGYVFHTEQDQKAFIVPESGHRWDAAYAEKTLREANDAMQEQKKEGILLPAEKGGLSPATLAELNQIARRMGNEKPVPVNVDVSTGMASDDIPRMALQNLPGAPREITVNKAAVTVPTQDEFLAVAGHELGHNEQQKKHKNDAAQFLAAAHNDPALAKQTEHDADLRGVAASCRPEALESFLRKSDEQGISAIKSLGISEADAKVVYKLFSADHPSTDDRVKEIREIGAELHKATNGSGCEVTEAGKQMLQRSADAVEELYNRTKAPMTR